MADEGESTPQGFWSWLWSLCCSCLRRIWCCWCCCWNFFKSEKNEEERQNITAPQRAGNPGYSSPNPRSKEVQVVMPKRTNYSSMHAKALSSICQELSFSCKMEYGFENLNSDLPLIVVCPMVSRVEPDIDSALHGLRWPSDFVALILHACTENSLPSVSSAVKLQDNKKYQNIEIIDIAFTNEGYLRPHRMNEDAKKEIKSFLGKYRI